MVKASVADRYLRTLENNHLENAPKSPPKSIHSPVRSEGKLREVSPKKSELNLSPQRKPAVLGRPTTTPISTSSSSVDTTSALPRFGTTPVKSQSPVKQSSALSVNALADKVVAKPLAGNGSVGTTTSSPIAKTGKLGPRPDRNPLMHNEDLNPSEVSWDRERKNWQTYEYLCHVAEAKDWVEKILNEDLPPADKFPESLQNGVALAKIVQTLRPELMKWPIFQHKRLQYRHTENITQFFDLLEALKIPQLFLFDMTDLYEKRNLPKVIYCIHAVSHFIAETEVSVSAVDNLVGKLNFSEDQINTAEKGLIGHSMPNFGAMTRQFSGKHKKLEELPEPEDDGAGLVASAQAEAKAEANMKAKAESDGKADGKADAKSEVKPEAATETTTEAEVDSNLEQPVSRMRLQDDKDLSYSEATDEVRHGDRYRPERGYDSRGRNRGQGRRDRDRRERTRQDRDAYDRDEVFSDYDDYDEYDERPIRPRRVRRDSYFDETTYRDRSYKDREYKDRDYKERGYTDRGYKEHGYKDRSYKDYDDSYGELSPPRIRRPDRGWAADSGSDEDYLPDIRIKPPRRQAHSRDAYRHRVDSLELSTRAVSRDMYHRHYAQHDGRHMRGYNYRNLSSTGSLRSRVLTSAEQMLIELEELEPEITSLVAICKGTLLRRAINRQRNLKPQEQKWLIGLQSDIRGRNVRTHAHKPRFDDDSEQMRSLVQFQSLVRSKAAQRSFKATSTQANDLVVFQSLARGVLSRRALNRRQTELGQADQVKRITRLQAKYRGSVVRHHLSNLYRDLEKASTSVVSVQAAARGHLIRRMHKRYHADWHDNLTKIITLQSVWRARAQGTRYRTLIGSSRPTLESIRPFLQLIDNKPGDYEMDLETENLTKDIAKHIKDNEKLEAVIEQLDMKISLLVKNNISIDEMVLRQQRQNQKLRSELKSDDAHGHADAIEPAGGWTDSGRSSGSVSASKDGLRDQYDIKSLQKPSRDRIELYQGLLYILQTQPEYLSHIMSLKPPRSLDIADLVLSVFGQGETSREMFYMLRQLAVSITKSTVGSPENTVAWCIVSHLNRRSSATNAARKILAPAAGKLKAMAEHLLEYDPHVIFEHLTGGGDLSSEEAIKDQAVQAIFVQNLHRLRDVTVTIVQSISEHAAEIPYHIKFIAREVYRAVLDVTDDRQEAMAAVGQVVISQFLQPALINADSLDLVDAAVGNTAKNLISVGRVLHQIGLMGPFTAQGGPEIYLQPLNDFVKSRSHQLAQSFHSTIVESADLESHFGLSEFDDVTMHERPILKIGMNKILSLHYMCYHNLDTIAGQEDSVLRPVIVKLGPLPRDAREMLDLARFDEIKLELNPTYGGAVLGETTSAVTSLFATAKRCLGYVLRVQSNQPDVMSVLIAPVGFEEEHAFNILLDTDNNREAAGDLAEFSFRDLKALTLEYVLELESVGQVSRENDYQALLNSIAEDIRNKDAVRTKRRKNLESKRKTLKSITEKGEYLQNRAEVYNKHINEAMLTLQTEAARNLAAPKSNMFHKLQLGAGKPAPAPDTQGPRFGSYRISAEKLYERGILLRMRGYTDRQRRDLHFTFSSDEVAKFVIEITHKSVLLPNGVVRISLDELLSQQYQNVMAVEFLGGVVQFSTNRLIQLIFGKFYGTNTTQ